jgi:hypothetical protein
MKNIKLLSMFALLAVGALTLTNCTTDDGTPDPSPVVNFLGGAAFVDEDISLAASTDFAMAITANHTQNIKSLKVTQEINGGVAVEVVDSTFSDKTITQFIYNGTTADTEGTEVYTFIVADKDGNSTSKSITITNLGNPGNDLVEFLADNDGETFKVWNFRGAKLGSYGITDGINYSSTDPDAGKDIQDSTTAAETGSWPARWTSRNGTEFRKVTASSWSTITNDAELLAAWDVVGTSETTVDVTDGDIYILDLGNGGAFALVEITAVESTSGDNNDYIQFRYKKQNL